MGQIHREGGTVDGEDEEWHRPRRDTDLQVIGARPQRRLAPRPLDGPSPELQQGLAPAANLEHARRGHVVHGPVPDGFEGAGDDGTAPRHENAVDVGVEVDVAAAVLVVAAAADSPPDVEALCRVHRAQPPVARPGRRLKHKGCSVCWEDQPHVEVDVVVDEDAWDGHPAEAGHVDYEGPGGLVLPVIPATAARRADARLVEGALNPPWDDG
mmetsp:Transcript_19513/g.54337  ORF Transcript_19513/g.54337 Transcript_19513/m.54337 type:complete len:212 (+) Transcript_19513:503-1138(+)